MALVSEFVATVAMQMHTILTPLSLEQGREVSLGQRRMQKLEKNCLL